MRTPEEREDQKRDGKQPIPAEAPYVHLVAEAYSVEDVEEEEREDVD